MTSTGAIAGVLGLLAPEDLKLVPVTVADLELVTAKLGRHRPLPGIVQADWLSLPDAFFLLQSVFAAAFTVGVLCSRHRCWPGSRNHLFSLCLQMGC